MAKTFGVLGSGIAYSLSPRIHTAIYRHYGIDATYEIVDCIPTDFTATVARLRAQFDGFNVTKPYKLDIMAHLNSYDTDAVNTVVVHDGRMFGHGTDAFGFTRHFTEFFDCKGADVLVLGAGGVAQVIVPQLVRLGARVYVLNRTAEKAQALCDRTGATVFDGTPPTHIVNCTSCGLHGNESPLRENVELTRLIGVYDTIYAPPETELMRQGRAAGAKAVNGLGMLIWQALKAAEYMCGVTPEQALYNAIYADLTKGE